MANFSSHAPQWGGFDNSSRDTCTVCTRTGTGLVRPCADGCAFRVHQRCFNWWKGSSAVRTCPHCRRHLLGDPDAQLTFPVGSRVLLGDGQDAQLVTISGFSYNAKAGRKYTVSSGMGAVFQVAPSSLTYAPLCRVCGSNKAPLEFNPCACRGSVMQFAHAACLGEGATCGACGVFMNGACSDEQQSAWQRVRGAFRLGFRF